MEYVTICVSLTQDRDFLALSPEAKLCFWTLRVWPETNITGIFPAYIEAIQHRTGLTGDGVMSALAELEKARYIKRDGPLTWIRNALRFDRGYRKNNPNHQKAIASALRTLPRSVLVEQFLERYELKGLDVRPKLAQRFDPEGDPRSNPDWIPDQKAIGSTIPKPKPKPKPKQQRSGAAARLFDLWVTVMEKDKATTVFSDKRKDLVRARLREYPEAYIVKAIRGCAGSAWHMGENDRGKKFNDLTLICRNSEKLEAFAEIHDGTSAPSKAIDPKSRPRSSTVTRRPKRKR